MRRNLAKGAEREFQTVPAGRMLRATLDYRQDGYLAGAAFLEKPADE